MRKLTVPERHRLKIARDTLKTSDAGALVMGGPNKAEAREAVRRLTGREAEGTKAVKAAVVGAVRNASLDLPAES